MLIIFIKFAVVFVCVFFVIVVHSLGKFFGNGFHAVHHEKCFPLVKLGGGNQFFCPLVRFAAAHDKNVCLLNFNNILGRWFKGVALLAGRKQHGNVCQFAGKLPRKVKGRKVCGDNF